MRTLSHLFAGAVRFAGSLARNEHGSTAMIFGLSAIAIIAAGGTGLDLARAMVVKARMAAALDAAGLAVGSNLNMDQDAMEDLAQKYFDANYPEDKLGDIGDVDVEQNGEKFELSVDGTVPTTLLQVIGIDTMSVNVTNEITRASVNLEVAMALDITGSMSGTRIADLKTAAKDLIDLVVQDTQDPYYSKVALVPYSNGVNLGSYAASARGPITAGKAITDVSWASGTAKNITGATKANPVVITSNGHGFSNGDKVYITGVKGMTQLNDKVYTVANKTTNTFQLQGINGSGYSNYKNSGTVTKCQLSTCEVTVTANGHGFASGAYVHITGVGGMTDLNNTTFTVASPTTNTFVLSGVVAPGPSSYTSGGTVYCTTAGCEYYYFTNAQGNPRTYQVSKCATERTGTEKYTDVAPATAYVGRQYTASSGNVCPTADIVPLSTDKVSLKASVDSYAAAGSTAGQIGTAWAWYMISPNFASLWPSASQPDTYDADELVKVVVIMTDGAYNTTYCNGVISKDATSGSGTPDTHINCNASNGDAFTQAENVCDAMKAQGVVVYTVGFDVGAETGAADIMNYCATDSSHVYLPNTGVELKDAFNAIAQDINSLRLSK